MAANDPCRDLAADLEELLQACLWERVGKGVWEKGRSRLRVDELGCFLYRLHPQRGWVRETGLCHMHMRHLPERLMYFPNDRRLDLLTGE